MGYPSSRYQRSTLLHKGDFLAILKGYRDEIKKSHMFKKLCLSLEAYRRNIVKIRCLAIGSFHGNFAPMWQLAFLMELADHLIASEPLVSLYDPVFTNEDLAFISKLRGWSVDEQLPPGWINDSNQILFFLPHAPLDLAELVLNRERPKYWLANHLIAHTDKYTQSQLFEKYPLISKLVNNLEKANNIREQVVAPQDGFTTFISRRKKRNRKAYQEPELDYSKINSYFTKCLLLEDFERGEFTKNQLWINSFSDMALHLIE